MLTRQQVRALAKTFFHDIEMRESNVRDRNGIVRTDVMRSLMTDLGYEVSAKEVDDVITEMYEYSRQFRGMEVGSSNGKGTVFELLRLLQQLVADCQEVSQAPQALIPGAVAAQELFLTIYESGVDVDRPAMTAAVDSINTLLLTIRRTMKDNMQNRSLNPNGALLLREMDDIVLRRLVNIKWVFERVTPFLFVDSFEIIGEDMQAQIFWSNAQSRFSMFIPWELFLEQLQSHVAGGIDLKQPWIHDPLRDAFVYGSDDVVLLPSFVRLVTLFGPFCTFLENFVQLIRLKAFEFHMNHHQAESKLSKLQPGSFILTCDVNNFKVLKLSVALAGNNVRTVDITHDGLWRCDEVTPMGSYLHVDELITLSTHLLSHPCGKAYESVPAAHSARSDDGKDVLHKAAWYGEPKAVEQLLIDGFTILLNQTTYFADPKKNVFPVYTGYSNTDRIFIQNRRMTPIISCLSCVTRDAVDVLKLLIQYGANVNLPDALGFTPLYYAFRYNHPKCIPILVAHGCTTTGSKSQNLMLALGPGPNCFYHDNINFDGYQPTVEMLETIFTHLPVPDIQVLSALRHVDDICSRKKDLLNGTNCMDGYLSDTQKPHNTKIVADHYLRSWNDEPLWRLIQKCLAKRAFVASCNRAKAPKEVAAPPPKLKTQRPKQTVQ